VKEKFFDIPIAYPLTAAKRKAVDKYIADNAHLSPSEVSYDWDEETGKVLLIATPPAKWEVRFYPKSVEIHGEAPFWARVLLTKDKRAKLKEEIERMLRETGLVDREGR